ncbi:hypothetical protein GJ496_005091 [Pomphorhynchus laevis]|nr:hypothetical protein GJ496_005091 [Pomphorhynchus laevis]
MNPLSSSDEYPDQLNKIRGEWRVFQQDLRQFSGNHREYIKKLNELENLKSECCKAVKNFQERLNKLDHSSQLLVKHTKNVNDVKLRSEINQINSELTEYQSVLAKISDTLPRPIETYLNVVLGPVPLCILNKKERWTYKEQYEKFKLAASILISFSCLLLLILPVHSQTDYLFQFLIMWYYCTLTIRESILVVNGSRIRRWWRFHHFLACINNGIILMWPHSKCYHSVRKYMIILCFYLTCVQTLQFYYQQGLLYRLRALGESKQMDVNLEGVHTWMLRGLGFLVPFLFIAYGSQLWIGTWLLKLGRVNDACEQEWHPYILGVLMLVFCTGNVITAVWVLINKYRQQLAEYEHWVNVRYEGLRSVLKSLDARKYYRSDSDCSDYEQSHGKKD